MITPKEKLEQASNRLEIALSKLENILDKKSDNSNLKNDLDDCIKKLENYFDEQNNESN